jgi:arylsulfatase A-like enzyme/Flp pilus assembly protein TadD
VLLISIDTLRADHLGAYGGKVETTNIDRLGAEGVVFERAVSQVPITLPSHASILTGTYPFSHQVHDNGSYRLAAEKESLAERLREHGYRTGAFVGSFALDSRFGLDQGFDVYDDLYGEAGGLIEFGISERPANAVLEPALSWILESRARKWFAFVHLYDPHAPYAPPDEYRSRAANPYDGEILYVDDALGDFLGRLREAGALENTLIVLTADHGEGLGEHGEKTHGMFAYESTLHVPLILSWPGALPPGRVKSRVRLIDVAPTVVEVTGAGSLEGYSGESLVPLALDPAEGRDRESYFEALSFHLNRGWAPLTGLYRDDRKYIRLPIEEMYDVSSDPAEKTNLFRAGSPEAEQMSQALDALVPADAAASGGAARPEVDEETAARLRSLGYIVTPGNRSPSRYTAEDDPKNLLHLADKFDEGIAAQLAGRPDEAMRLFREILAERPSFANAYANLAHVLAEQGRFEEAIGVLELALAKGAETESMLSRLGCYLQEAGRLEDSARVLETVIRANPDDAEAYNFLGITYARLGRRDDALRAIEHLLTLDPSYASAYVNLGSIHLAASDFTSAETSLRKALSIDPKLATAWNGLGVALASTGRGEEALDAWRRTIDLDPREYETLYNLGTLLTKLNRFEEAIGYLERFVAEAPPSRFAADIPKVKRLIEVLSDQEAHRRAKPLGPGSGVTSP